MRLRLVLALLACLALTGCVEADEVWTLDGNGGGTYALTLRWNGDLWRRVGDVLGAKVMQRIAGRGFPLRPEQWADGLAGLEGVTVVDLAETETDTALRELAVKLKFERLEDLLGWEVLARRTLRVTSEAAEGGAPARATLWMEPLARVPVLDTVGALLDAAERPPPAPEGVAAERDPGPLARLGIERAAADMVWRMLKLPLDEVQLKVTVKTPGDLVSVRGSRPLETTREASFGWTFADLRKAEADRTVRCRWRILELDRVPGVDHRGERDGRGRNADGSRR